MRLWISSFIMALVGATLLAGVALAQTGGATRFILAASWQPAFCEANRTKPECVTQTDERFDARNFSLHGLWPMRKDYCGIPADHRETDRDGKWVSLPAIELSEATKRELDRIMPGTQSGLERHEWVKHGSCSGIAAEDYFRHSIELLEELNGSAVRALFAANIGKPLDEAAIKRAFEESFGEGAGDRVRMSCRRVGGIRVISELTIGLSADAVAPAQDGRRLGKLMQGAGTTRFGCDEGIVDAAGF